MTVSPADAVEATEEATESHAAAEGVDAAETSGAGSSSTLREMLFSTSPNPSLETVESPFDPETGGINRVYRGFQKMAGVDGLPAIADVMLGLAEFVTGHDLSPGSDDDGGDESADADAAPVGGEK